MTEGQGRRVRSGVLDINRKNQHTQKRRMTTNIKAIENKVAVFSLLNKSLRSFLSSPEANIHKSLVQRHGNKTAKMEKRQGWEC